MLPKKHDQKATKPSVLHRAMKRFKERVNPVRIGFIIDGTGSRAGAWQQAQVTQGNMFRATAGLRSLSLRLIHFGGDLVTDHGWSESPDALAAEMATVECAVGLTQILRALTTFIADRKARRAHAIILVGDAFEENEAMAEERAHTLKNAGIKVLAFLEGDNKAADRIFKRLAEVTGGRFARFGDDLPLSDLCEGVALLTAGGKEGLSRLSNKKAKHLLLGGPDNT